MMRRRLLALIFTLLALTSNAQRPEFPKEINLVFDYLLKKDYPEVFNDKSYQFRPISWQIIDIDNDGKIEVFLQTFPHYSQSPSITVFKIDERDSVKRIIEGLAPGHLIPLSREDDYISPHTTGTAIDGQVDKSDRQKLSVFANASMKFGMSCVLYKNFIHTDRKKNMTYLDLTYLNDYASENSCAKFQFSKPTEIIAGKLRGGSNKYFIARVENELFCYEIKGFENDTFINKTVTVIKAPSNMAKLVTEDGYIKYLTKKGKYLDLDI